MFSTPSPRRGTRAEARADGVPLIAGPSRVLVTGGAGFIGSHLCAELLRRGHGVHVIDDLSTGRRENLAEVVSHPMLRTTVASVADPAVAARACENADVVFHLAGVVGVRRLAREPLEVMQRNLRCTEVIAAAAAAAGVPLLSTSSSEVYGDGPVPFREQDSVRPGATESLRGGYACAKAMGEWLAFGHAQQSGLPVVIARLFNTVGPRQSGEGGMVLPRFVAQALRGEPITVYGSGEHTRCFAHVAEVVRALADLAETPGARGLVFNVGSAVETTVRDLALLVRDRAGSRSPIVLVPFAEVFPTGFADPPRRVPCLERLARVIGWVPSRPLVSIVDELIELARSRTGPGTVLTQAVCR
ncbi:MAG TPA: NAD-dependent epimerase/dehydratase family protein [Planctomycetota bacterium]|nr:NAD-dependent epimerase/dehydratase family protein [Planctomycetota bacterium]